MGKAKLTNWMVILNPQAGSGQGRKDVEKIRKRLHKAGFQFELFISNYPQHAIHLTMKGIERGYRKLIVAGGDGTMNEVANGVLQQQVCAPSEVIVGMIPVGTGNDWIKTFGIPNNYKKAIKRIRKGKTILQDVGLINYQEGEQQKQRFFTNMAGFGFDALVAQKANRLKEKGHTGWRIYLQSLVTGYLNYQTRKVSLRLDGEKVEDLIFSTSIGIGKYNGGGMMQAPGAIPNNGVFQVTVIREIGLGGILKNLPGLFNGQFVNDERVSVFQASKVVVASENQIEGEADGENLGNHQFELEILPQQLQVIVGKKSKVKLHE
ncbi:diacylglycerol kinase family protein [uncultured Sunxiuqinia sp.]|uniref:diacylglycerol/lipid kinase family protein n=1 Tax=uncultured Sunxiuqinia sp. TaxID=1573825 RepID=UPI0026257AF2|nr:diacylglycerol kinase family protein [uncultured Sunxiuqinia sp.]